MTPVKLKAEPVVKAEHRCLTSPEEILALYQVPFTQTPSKKPKVDICIQMSGYICMCICICISNILQGGQAAWYSWCLDIHHRAQCQASNDGAFCKWTNPGEGASSEGC